MSSIAEAWIVRRDDLLALAERAERQQWDSFWSSIRSRARPVLPEYNRFAGYVVAVVIAYLDEQGVITPMDTDREDVKRLARVFPNLVACMGWHAAREYTSALATVSQDAGILRDFFEEFQEEQWPEAGQAMAEGLDYLAGAAQQVESPEEYVMVSIG